MEFKFAELLLWHHIADCWFCKRPGAIRDLVIAGAKLVNTIGSVIDDSINRFLSLKAQSIVSTRTLSGKRLYHKLEGFLSKFIEYLSQS